MSLISKAKIRCFFPLVLVWFTSAKGEKERTKTHCNNWNLVSFLSQGIIAALGNSCHHHKCFHFKANILIINTLPKKTFGGSRKHQIELN